MNCFSRFGFQAVGVPISTTKHLLGVNQHVQESETLNFACTVKIQRHQLCIAKTPESQVTARSRPSPQVPGQLRTSTMHRNCTSDTCTRRLDESQDCSCDQDKCKHSRLRWLQATKPLQTCLSTDEKPELLATSSEARHLSVPRGTRVVVLLHVYSRGNISIAPTNSRLCPNAVLAATFLDMFQLFPHASKFQIHLNNSRRHLPSSHSQRLAHSEPAPTTQKVLQVLPYKSTCST